MSEQMSLLAAPVRPWRIEVWNMHEDGWEGREGWKGPHIYIGRPSILGNPWIVSVDGSREACIEQYRQWLGLVVKDGLAGKLEGGDPEYQFSAEEARRPGIIKARSADPEVRAAVWARLKQLWWRTRNKEQMNLVCYCKPKACHGDVLKSCLEYLASSAPEVQTSELTALTASGPLPGGDTGREGSR